MLKGIMKIELTDVRTGKKETVREQNMVTDALADIFKPIGYLKSPSKLINSFAPYHQNLLGGLLLFDSSIEENPANYYPPARARLIGCASYGEQNNTTGTLRGGYNQTESELNMTDRFMKYVYDFTTSQANGTISCVCLTHKNAGYTSYGSNDAVYTSSYPLSTAVCDGVYQFAYPSYTGGSTSDKYSGYTVGTTELLFVIDRVTDAAYYVRIDSTKKATIIKRRANLKSVSVIEQPYSLKAYMEGIPLENLSLGSYVAYNFDHATNALYLNASSASYIKPNEEFRVIKIEMGTWRVTQYSVANTTDVNLTTSGTRFAFIHDGFAYLKSNSSPYDVYKFEIGNAANVAKLKRNGIDTVQGLPQLAVNGRIYYESTGSSGITLCIANAETNEILKPENIRIINNSSNLYCYTPVLNEPMLYSSSLGTYSTGNFILLLNYLATINNLTEPVTKTADKTMKITYIVQEQ